MIQVSKDQLAEVEYLLGQSAQGNHVLFDKATIRLAADHGALSEEQAYEMEPHLERILDLPTLEQKHAYVAALDFKTRVHVVLAYLNIVANSVFETSEHRH
jgi:hypothetical protein